MIRILIKAFSPRVTLLTGASRGEQHFALMKERLLGTDGLPDEVSVLLDFKGIAFASASYLKAAVLALVTREIGVKTRNIAVFPVVTNIGKETQQELTIACRSERLVCLEALKQSSGLVTLARFYGESDRILRQTLQLLIDLRKATAAEVAERAPEERINLTAWNNRLAELFRFRLAKRIRDGRFWRYEPTALQVKYG